MASYLAVCTHAMETEESRGCCGAMDSEATEALAAMLDSRR